MKNVISTPGLQLAPGAYWLDWQSGGSLASGPWAPPISFPSVTITGDAMQFNGASFAWASIIDTAQAGPTDDAAQGLPFTIHGTIAGAVNELYANNNVSVYPNPMNSTAVVTVSDNIKKSFSDFSFVIYDVLGNLIRKTDGITTNKFTIKKENIPAGVYIYELRNGNEIIKRGKLSIQNE